MLSGGLPNTAAMRKAASSEGECLPSSIAFHRLTSEVDLFRQLLLRQFCVFEAQSLISLWILPISAPRRYWTIWQPERKISATTEQEQQRIGISC